MSETQAKETEAEIEAAEGEEDVITEPEAIEIKVEDGDKPSPKKVSRFETRLRNKNDQITEAQAEAQRIKEELEATKAERDLLKLRDKQQKPPNEDDFEDTFEYQRAKDAYDENRIAEIAAKKAQEIVKQNNQQTYQASQSQKQAESIGSHYQRADSLNVKNYDELEGNAMSILGEQFVQTIIENTDNSEMLLASIGASPGKAGEIAALLTTSPAKAFAKAVSFPINPNLNGTSLNTPDPETKIKPGEPTQLKGWELKLDKARDKAAVSGDFSYIAQVKKDARAAGVEL